VIGGHQQRDRPMSAPAGHDVTLRTFAPVGPHFPAPAPTRHRRGWPPDRS